MRRDRLKMICLLSIVIAAGAVIFLRTRAGQTEQVNPTEVTADFDGTIVSLKWEYAENAEYYRIYRKNTGENDYKFLDDVKKCEYEDAKVEQGIYYVYKICAVGKDGISTGVEIEPDLKVTRQEKPDIFAVTRMNRWKTCIQYTKINDAIRYEVYRSGEENGEYMKVGESTDSVFYDTNAEGISDAYYKVKAISNYGDSLWSEAQFTGYNAQEVCVVPVMMYHDCVTNGNIEEGILFDEYAVWYNEFEEDLIYLRDHGYTTITAEQMIDFMEGKGELPEKPVFLTIDDGKLGVYRNMYPLLEKYHMTASLAVIGEEIDNATRDIQARGTSQAPYCTWTEIGEMSASGHVEIISHTYYLHAYNRNNRVGADVATGETEENFLTEATADWTKMQKQLLNITEKNNLTLCYPYSVRSEASDKGWLKCGYKLLLAGNDENVSRTMANYAVYGAGCTPQSAVLRRLPRMTGTPLEEYLAEVGTDEKE